MNNKTKQNLEQDSGIIQSNIILLNFEGWIKYISGFIKGIQSASTVNSSVVMDCIGEILEYMVQAKKDIRNLFEYCETILEENEELKRKLEELQDDTEN